MLRVVILSFALLAACAVPASAQLPLPPLDGSSTAPPAVAPGPPGTDSVTSEGLDAAHDNWSGDGNLRPPFGELWKVPLDEAPSSILTGGGRVFVLVANGRKPVVMGLDGAAGTTLWRYPVAPLGDIALAGDRLVVAAGDHVRGLDPASGRVTWERSEPGVTNVTPVGGDVAFESKQGGTITAKLVDAATGASRWEVKAASAELISRPSAAGDRIYFTTGCDSAAFDRRNGNVIWSRDRCGPGEDSVMSRLVDTRIALRRRFDPSTEGWLNAGDGSDAKRVAGGYAFADGLSVGLDDSDHNNMSAYRLSDGALVWTLPMAGYSPEPVAVADQLMLSDGAHLNVLGLHDGALRWTGMVRKVGSVGQIVPGGGLLLLGTQNGLLALAPQSRTGPPPLSLQPPRQAHPFGKPYTVRGRAGRDLTTTTQVHVEADPYPYGRGHRTERTLTTGADGAFKLRTAPPRATRYRFSVEGGKAKSWYALVLPRYGLHFRHATPTRIVARVSVRLARSVPARGHVLGIYVGRARAKRLVRLARTRLGGRRGSFHATARFAALRHVGSKDFIALCVGGLVRYGIGYGNALERRCGTRSLSYR